MDKSCSGYITLVILTMLILDAAHPVRPAVRMYTL